MELETRLELPEDHPYFGGIDTTMSIDSTLHSLFGVSKAAADLLVQEYGRYFDMPTVCFRGGCLTGPNHAGAQLHGFLAYLMKCTVTGEPYTVFGYEGKQVRDNIHAADLVDAFLLFHASPQRGGRLQHRRRARATPARCSRRSSSASGSPGASSSWELSDEARIGDHRWWISDLDEFGARLRRLAPAARPGDDPARDLRRQRRALGLAAGMKLSVVIPAHNEEELDRRDASRALVSTPRARGDRPRGDRRRRLAAPTAPRTVVERIAERAPAGPLPALALPQRLRLRRARRPRRASRATRWRS